MGNVLRPASARRRRARRRIDAGVPDTTVRASRSTRSAARACARSWTPATTSARGEYDLVVAGGMESMSNAPYLAASRRATGYRMGNGKLVDSMIHDGLWDPVRRQAHGHLRRAVRREVQVHARGAGRVRARVVRARAGGDEERRLRATRSSPSRSPRRRATPSVVDADEEPFAAPTRQDARALKPAFEKDGTVTAANASKINDGAAALVVPRERARAGERLDSRSRASSRYVAASRRRRSGSRPRPPRRCEGARSAPGSTSTTSTSSRSTRRSPSVAMAVRSSELELDPAKVNVRGGAVALGHPIGARGARILTTLSTPCASATRSAACAAICIGGGEATAMLVRPSKP